MDLMLLWRSGELLAARSEHDNRALMVGFLVKVGKISGRHWSDIIGYGLRGV